MRLRVVASLAAFLALFLMLPSIQRDARALALVDKNCKDFQTWQEAQSFFLSAGSGDPNRLDTNHNGIACESLPGAPGTARSPTAVSAAASAPTATATALPTEASASPTVTPTPHPATPPQSATRTRTVPRAAPTPSTAAGDAIQPSSEAPPDSPVPPPVDPSVVPPTPTAAATPIPTTTQQTVSVWVVALAPTSIFGPDDEELGTLEVGERVRLIAVEDGSALVVLPIGSGTGWIVLDERIQLVAQ